MKLKISKIKIGEVGTIEIKIPFIKMGEGKPKGVIISGLHGKETSGLLVIMNLLEQITNIGGQIIIIPSVNPFGQILSTRNEPMDEMDLNRIFPGSNRKNFSQRIAANIFSLIADADFVIDLHCFSRIAPTTAVLINSDDKKIMKKQKEMIKAFLPEIVWVKDPEKDKVQNALDVACLKQGIPALTVEVPKIGLISPNDIEKASQGIMNILALFGMSENKTGENPDIKIPIFEFKMFFSDLAGVFTPLIKPLTKIEKGQKIGTVSSLISFKKKDILSPKSGILTTIQPTGLIRTGTKLFTIGKKTGEI